MLRLLSESPAKGRKPVGYWLLTCGGMVFIAVVLGIVMSYYVILFSIYKVVEYVVEQTVGK